jgi:hypothetical protein
MKQKAKIIHHHQEMLDWVGSLNDMPETLWHTSIEKGKWSPAEIISHFVPWDAFILEKRIPYFNTDMELPQGPENAEVFNSDSARLGRNTEKGATIQRFNNTRIKLMNAIRDIEDDLWQNSIKIGSSELFIIDYFNGLAEHDLHHKKQIKSYMQRQV